MSVNTYTHTHMSVSVLGRTGGEHIQAVGVQVPQGAGGTAGLRDLLSGHLRRHRVLPRAHRGPVGGRVRGVVQIRLPPHLAAPDGPGHAEGGEGEEGGHGCHTCVYRCSCGWGERRAAGAVGLCAAVPEVETGRW